MKKETIIGVLLAIMTIWAIGFTAPKLYQIYKYKPKTEIKVDTVITEKHDTILLTNHKPYTEIRYKKVVDTLKTTDSVFVPVEVPLSIKKYEGDTMTDNNLKIHYRANVTGYRASLDSLWFAVERKDTTIYKEVTKWKKKKGFKLAPYAGYGYNPVDKKMTPSIGVALVYLF